MKKLIYIIMLLIFSYFSKFQVEEKKSSKKNIEHSKKSEIPKEVRGKVLYIPDGDTIHITMNGEKFKIRFYGIDCPEISQPYGLEAKEFLMRHIDKNDVKVEVVEKDRYGRLVGKVYSRGVYLNELMVEEGYAWWYKNYAKKEKKMEILQIRAEKEKKGLWSQENPQAPWEYRKKK
ncbi:thermonuclease family protein [uncultured Ilyobacter sp.]|uniref:thermonuclease family protein n=1 Tax=uncultured Ilyobacter sp. TaxID=544433 RepID=UPI0029C84422|nr:thermonuclease family protein [uncultured Ilyobacter sp.]